MKALSATLRQTLLVGTAATACLLLPLLCAQAARATTVAYIDGNEVWVAKTDGTLKTRLSAGENEWRQLAQSDQGQIVAVRLPDNKVSGFSSFKVWDPDGREIAAGPLSGVVGGLVAYPLGLDISPDGKSIYYGFSQFNLGSLRTGYYMIPSASKAGYTPEPPVWVGKEWPTLVGDRAVVKTGNDVVAVQSERWGTEFTPWFQVLLEADETLTRTDVAATGTLAATESHTGSGTSTRGLIGFSRADGLGGGLTGWCNLATEGTTARQVSIAQDAGEFAWQDSGGVKVAGSPTFAGGGTSCALARPATVISATGSSPSLGQFRLSAATAAQGSGVKLVKPPAKLKISTLAKKGLLIKVSAATKGTAKLSLSVTPKSVGRKGRKAIPIATGSAKVSAGRTKSVRLKFNRTGKKLRKRLKGKKAKLTVKLGRHSATRSVRLR